ncbi:hypothetical protein ACO0LM_16865 [Undibacterium sp. Di26W]|uniref:hypothetical protein n=1 Tax=Undibacterium sp. Di26W TaxID=3413035 RepID=UPI003BF1A6AE
MKLSRPSRLAAVFIALFSMLFMQLALASYACPGMTTGGGQDSAQVSLSTDNAPMPGCERMDKEQPGLCHAHAQNEWSKQSLDKPSIPDVQAFTPAGIVLVIRTADFTATVPQTAPASRLLRHQTAPPISIRNCCFRI